MKQNIINNHVWVSESYRDFIAEKYGITKLWQWKLLEYLLFYPHIDRAKRIDDVDWNEDDQHQIKASDRIRVGEEYIRRLTGIKRGKSENSIYALLIEFFRAMGMGRECYKIYCHYQMPSPLTRSISVSWDDELIEASEKEIMTPWRDKKNIVFFTTGQSWSERKQQECNRAYLREIEGTTIHNEEHPAAELVRYLHSNRVNKHLAKQVQLNEKLAMKVIADIREPSRRLYAVRVYNMVRQCPYAKYTDSAKTARIYSTGYTILQLPREVRKAVFDGLYSLDLRSSQLAIVADLWGIKKVRAFLDTKSSIWTELLQYIELDDSYKPDVKELLYSMVFGMARENLNNKAIEKLGSDKILHHPLIRELLECRDKKLNELVDNGGAKDVWGTFHPITQHYYRKDRINHARKVLSRIVQSYEMEIMLAGFELLNGPLKKQLCMVAWLHDGIYIAPTWQHRYARKYLYRINDAVVRKASSLGIRTELEIEPDED